MYKSPGSASALPGDLFLPAGHVGHYQSEPYSLGRILAAQVFGMPATVIVDAYVELEKDIWTHASTVMTPEQMEELKDMINIWRADGRA
jgi:hypothetical protein